MNSEFITDFLANPWALATTAFVLGLLFGVLLRGAFDGDDRNDDEPVGVDAGDPETRAAQAGKIDLLAGEVEALRALIDEQARRDAETMDAMGDLDKAVAGVSKHLEKLVAEIDNARDGKA